MSFTRVCRLPCFNLDASHQCTYLVGHEMVHLNRDPAATGLIHESRGLFDRLRLVHFRSFGSAHSPDVAGRHDALLVVVHSPT
jgi:hypothetical protein